MRFLAKGDNDSSESLNDILAQVKFIGVVVIVFFIGIVSSYK